MCSIELEDQSNILEPSQRTRYGIRSLLLAGLTIVIISSLVALDIYLTDRGILSFESPIYTIEYVIFVGASLLPLIGIGLARRGILKRTEPRAASIFGLISNSALFLVVTLFVIWTIYHSFIMAKIEGVFLINDEPVRDALLLLSQNCTHETADERSDTLCDSGLVRGTHTEENGSFRFLGLELGDYSLHTNTDLPTQVTCTSASSYLTVETWDAWDKPDSTVVAIDAVLSIPRGIGETVSLDIKLVCR